MPSNFRDLRFSAVIRLLGRMRRASHRGMILALRQAPRCHYALLERLHCAIDRHGQNGSIYVSDLTAALNEPPPAVSRALRTLEQDGLALRRTDPRDRRKTLVCLTPEGEAAHQACEQAMQQYFCAVMDDLGPERSDRLYNDIVALVEALERRNDLAMGNAGSGKPDPENGREIHT